MRRVLLGVAKGVMMTRFERKKRRRGMGTTEWVVVAGAIVLVAVLAIATMGRRVQSELGVTAGDVADPAQLTTRFQTP